MLEYWLLLSSGFISATLLPGGSEALFLYYLAQDFSRKWPFFVAVTLGNSLGGFITYLLGYYCQFGQKKAAANYPKVFIFCQKWGYLALLLSWLPVIGDVICLLSGWLRLPRSQALLCITLGKSLRYLVLLLLFALAI